MRGPATIRFTSPDFPQGIHSSCCANRQAAILHSGTMHSFYVRRCGRTHHVHDALPGTIRLLFPNRHSSVLLCYRLTIGVLRDIRSVPAEYAKSPDWETSTFSVFHVIENPGVANAPETYFRIVPLPTRLRLCPERGWVVCGAAASQSASVRRIAASSAEKGYFALRATSGSDQNVAPVPEFPADTPPKRHLRRHASLLL